MLTLYRIALYLALPIILVRLLYRGARNNQYLFGIPQRFAYNYPLTEKIIDENNTGKTRFNYQGILIHAVSVGEVNAAAPLIKRIQQKFPDTQITITTMTPTGSNRVKNLFGNGVYHFYLPYDYPGAMKRFLDKVRPNLAMVMETEIWPNLINECFNRHIPMIYTNVRLSAQSFRGYSNIRRLISPTLGKISQFAVQSTADANRLINLGADAAKINVTGSIKFELTIPASIVESAHSVRRDFGTERPVWIAGSTRDGEEPIVLDAYLKAKTTIPDMLLVLVPRHPERFAAVEKICKKYGCNTILRSQTSETLSSDIDIYIGDTMGDLTLLLCAGDVAFIGGSLVPTGGHNLLEACAAGVAVIFGPHMFNFEEISNIVLAKGAGVQVMNSEELSDVVVKLIQDPVCRNQYGSQGKELISENKGALGQIMEMVEDQYSA